jgi:predicted permease
VFGLAPALQATRLDVNTTMRSGSDIGGSHSRLRNSLLGIQVGVSTVLLIAAGLLLRSVARAQSADPGFIVDHAVTMTFDLHAEAYNQQRAVAFHRELEAVLKTLPGVVAVAEANTAPLGSRHYFAQFGIPGENRRAQMQYNNVTPGFFASVGIPIIRGRDFDASDNGGRVAITTEAAARLFWPGQDPIGKTIKGDQVYSVVGVVRDAQVSELGQTHEPFLYLGAGDRDALELTSVIVRSSASEATVATALRAAALAVDRDLHFKIAPLRDNLKPYVQASRFLATLSSTLAALALLLASLGIYGTVAFVVARRRREIGIRMALGAQKEAVIALMTRQAMRPVISAALIGLAVAALVARVLQRVLFGVSTLDAVAFVGVPIVLTIVALLASYLPARRAARVDPMVALRAE